MENGIARHAGERHIAGMKILVNCPLPFALAHGGQAIQIQSTMAALQKIGVEAEPLCWWDEKQTGDIIHYFGRMPADQIQFAHQRNFKIVMAEFLTAAGSQTAFQLQLRRSFRWAAEKFAPPGLSQVFSWQSYRLADALIALTPREKELMTYKFDAPPGKIFVVPNGVEEVFFQSPGVKRGSWLVCAATITERKRVLELAQAAAAAQTPVWIIGKAYADNDTYAQKFFQLAKENPQFIRYEGAINDRAKLAEIYRAARGFVLLSTMESLSLSALEASACECPLLLSDLPWAHGSFSAGTEFCAVTDSTATTAAILRKFYNKAPGLCTPVKPLTWIEVAAQLKVIYEQILRD